MARMLSEEETDILCECLARATQAGSGVSPSQIRKFRDILGTE